MSIIAATLAVALSAATDAVPTAATNAPPTAANDVAPAMAHITSAKTYYDRKEGFAYFSGHVHVDDARYQLHADKAYVFMSGTNDLQRIVAMGNVAMTNETKRAYGEKASYYRDAGMVVLYGSNARSAEVRDETPKGTQSVRGRKIKFWVNSEQVEVVEAEISAPSEGSIEGLKGSLMGK